MVGVGLEGGPRAHKWGWRRDAGRGAVGPVESGSAYAKSWSLRSLSGSGLSPVDDPRPRVD